MRLRQYKSIDSKTIEKWVQDEEVFTMWGGEHIGKYPIDACVLDDKYTKDNGGCTEDDNFYPWTATDEEGNVVLADEMLTPDSSRFWPADGYEPGHGQPSFDKQFVRDWLKANPDSDYNLPQDIIDKTISKYLEAYELLTGRKL